MILEVLLFVALFIITLIVHEVGHVLAFRAIGMKARIYTANYGLYVKTNEEYRNIKTTPAQFLLITWSGALGCVPVLVVWLLYPHFMIGALLIIWFLYSVFEPLLTFGNLWIEDRRDHNG